jgi:hypothetical protein
MSVFNIKDVVEQTVASQTFNEVLLSFFKIVTEVFLKECFQSPWFNSSFLWEFLLQTVNGYGIWYELY